MAGQFSGIARGLLRNRSTGARRLWSAQLLPPDDVVTALAQAALHEILVVKPRQLFEPRR
jgi:hypothetical protein